MLPNGGESLFPTLQDVAKAPPSCPSPASGGRKPCDQRAGHLSRVTSHDSQLQALESRMTFSFPRVRGKVGTGARFPFSRPTIPDSQLQALESRMTFSFPRVRGKVGMGARFPCDATRAGKPSQSPRRLPPHSRHREARKITSTLPFTSTRERANRFFRWTKHPPQTSSVMPGCDSVTWMPNCCASLPSSVSRAGFSPCTSATGGWFGLAAYQSSSAC